jgi:hypothetical protein
MRSTNCTESATTTRTLTFGKAAMRLPGSGAAKTQAIGAGMLSTAAVVARSCSPCSVNCTPRHAGEQRDAEVLLQQSHLPAQSGLGDHGSVRVVRLAKHRSGPVTTPISLFSPPDRFTAETRSTYEVSPIAVPVQTPDPPLDNGLSAEFNLHSGFLELSGSQRRLTVQFDQAGNLIERLVTSPTSC